MYLCSPSFHNIHGRASMHTGAVAKTKAPPAVAATNSARNLQSLARLSSPVGSVQNLKIAREREEETQLRRELLGAGEVGSFGALCLRRDLDCAALSGPGGSRGSSPAVRGGAAGTGGRGPAGFWRKVISVSAAFRADHSEARSAVAWAEQRKDSGYLSMPLPLGYGKVSPQPILGPGPFLDPNYCFGFGFMKVF